MNKQAYEKSVGHVLSKQADFDWKSLWNGFKQHFKDNEKHYRRAAYVGLPAMILGGAFGGRQGVGLGLLASIATGLGSKGWDLWKTQQEQQPSTGDGPTESPKDRIKQDKKEDAVFFGENASPKANSDTTGSSTQGTNTGNKDNHDLLTPMEVYNHYLMRPNAYRLFKLMGLEDNGNVDIRSQIPGNTPSINLDIITESLSRGTPDDKRVLLHKDTPMVPISNILTKDIRDVVGMSYQTASEYTGEGGFTPQQYYEAMWQPTGVGPFRKGHAWYNYYKHKLNGQE